MGHKRSGTFAYYVQVQDDTQSAFIETPARDALIKLATNSSLTRDASAPQDLSDQRKQELEKDPALISLKGKRDMLRAELIALHHQLRNGRGTDLYREFQRASNKVRSERKKLYRAAKNQEHTEFFENVGNHIIKQNYQGNPISFEPDVSHVMPERKALADLEFKNRDVDKINDAELVEDRIHSLELRLALHNLNVPRALQRRVRFNGPSVDVITEFPASPKSETGLECPVCLGRADIHPRAKKYTYARKDTLQRHFATHKLRQKFPDGRKCNYPSYDMILYSLPKYKLHQAKAHNIIL